MLAVALLVFREVLEAALIVTVVAAATRGMARRGTRAGQAMPHVGIEVLDARCHVAAVQAFGNGGCQQRSGQRDDARVLPKAPAEAHA